VKTFVLYTKRLARKRGEKDRWQRVGVAFKDPDGTVHVTLDAFPANRIELRIKEVKGRR